MSKDKKGGAGDELDELKAKLLAREMKLITESDNMKCIQQRSHEIELHMNKISDKAKEEIKNLEDIISLTNSDTNVKDKRIADLEVELQKLKDDSEATFKKMTNELEAATASFEFKYESVKLQLEAAQVRLRELHEFGQKKAQLEKELLDTRSALLKEHESKIEMVGEAERASYAAQEKMRKQMETIVAETEARMTKTIELQLHTKTKKTIIENEELKAEVQYHTQATMTLYKENERLIEENQEHVRTIDLLNGIKAELEQKNYMYQKTLRILVHKLREKENQLAKIVSEFEATSKAKKKQGNIVPELTSDQKKEEEEFQELLIRSDGLKNMKNIPRPKKLKTKDAPKFEQSQEDAQESAIEFLYTCLEDMELEAFTKMVEGGAESSESFTNVPLDQLNMKQRHDLLKSLLKRATTIRLMTRGLSSAAALNRNKTEQHVPYTPNTNPTTSGGNVVFDVQDVLDIPVEDIMGDEPGDRSSLF